MSSESHFFSTCQTTLDKWRKKASESNFCSTCQNTFDKSGETHCPTCHILWNNHCCRCRLIYGIGYEHCCELGKSWDPTKFKKCEHCPMLIEMRDQFVHFCYCLKRYKLSNTYCNCNICREKLEKSNSIYCSKCEKLLNGKKHCQKCCFESDIDSNENHCCQCKISIGPEEKHCCKCKKSFPSETIHCKTCCFDSNINEQHCCECRERVIEVENLKQCKRCLEKQIIRVCEHAKELSSMPEYLKNLRLIRMNITRQKK